MFEIRDNRIILHDENLIKTNITCGTNNGSIKKLSIYDPLYRISATTWKDENGVIVGNAADVSNLPTGTYTLIITTSDGCTVTYGPVILTNTTGPNINESNPVIQPTNCGQTTGSITGITASGTGTLKYSWKNESLQQVATTADLTNQPAGKYTLQVIDETTCGPVYTTELVIPETNGITLNDAGRVMTAASCGNANGTIKGIVVTGATQYKWVNGSGVTVATTLDLQNVPSGSYAFNASNSFGCSQNRNYILAEKTGTQYPAYEIAITASCTGQTNGAITVNTNALVASQRWVSSQNVTVATSQTLANIAAGSYSLYLTDANGCETYYNKFVVPAIAPLIIIAGSEHINNDQCGLKSGSITGIQITGGDASKTKTYTWTNVDNKVLSTTLNIDKLGAGSYQLSVKDVGGCSEASLTYVINNFDAGIAATPKVNPVDLCSPGDVVISVANASPPYSYRLYDTELSLNPIAQQADGNFKIKATTERSYFVSQFSGNCESARTKVNISISGIISGIPNAFTPNGDGVNDLWKLPGIENKPAVVVQVFSRYGNKVFESKGYAKPFDGTFNGKLLPVGTYYYMINFGSGCKLISGNLAIIR